MSAHPRARSSELAGDSCDGLVFRTFADSKWRPCARIRAPLKTAGDRFNEEVFFPAQPIAHFRLISTSPIAERVLVPNGGPAVGELRVS